MNNKTIVVIVIAILAVGGFLLFRNRSIAPANIEVDSNMPVEGSGVEEVEVVEEPSTNVKEFSVDATPFSFSPSTISVNKGDTVKIIVKNVNGTHDFKIDEFNVSTRTLKIGETQTITFVADKTGAFKYYCSVGNHRAQGMEGTLTVH